MLHAHQYLTVDVPINLTTHTDEPGRRLQLILLTRGEQPNTSTVHKEFVKLINRAICNNLSSRGFIGRGEGFVNSENGK